MAAPWGALPGGWQKWIDLGLADDLLPVVSNPNATISPRSSMRQLGKTPSLYNQSGQAVGFSKWTQHKSTPDEIRGWASQPDYGICVQTRHLRAIDVDSEKIEIVGLLRENFLAESGISTNKIPIRYRDNSNKILIPVFVEGDIPKTAVTTSDGIIEFLGNGQQFIAEGTHPSGERYKWTSNATPPVLTPAQYSALISLVNTNLGITPLKDSKTSTHSIATGDIYDALADKGMIIEQNRNDSYSIVCPFEHEHTTETGSTATVYWPAYTGGYAHESIKCLHAHCADRSMREWRRALGLDGADVFDALPDVITPDIFEPPQKLKYQVVPAFDFAQSGEAPEYLIDGLIPCAATGYLYGASGVGKTFAILDIAFAIAQGDPWNGLDVKQGETVYVCAEGAYAFRNRIIAYAKHNNIDMSAGCGVGVIDASPDLMNAEDVKDLAVGIKAYSPDVAHVVLDTMATCIRGDENSSQDIGLMLANIKGLRKYLNPLLTVTLIHHTGKDASKGARGASRLRNDCDFEIEVARDGHDRAMIVTKQKDGPDGQEYPFKLRSVYVYSNAKGKKVNSCVVEYPSGEEQASIRAKRGLSKSELSIYEALQEHYQINQEWPERDGIIEHVEEVYGGRKGDLNRAVATLMRKDLIAEQGDRLRLIDVTKPQPLSDDVFDNLD